MGNEIQLAVRQGLAGNSLQRPASPEEAEDKTIGDLIKYVLSGQGDEAKAEVNAFQRGMSSGNSHFYISDGNGSKPVEVGLHEKVADALYRTGVIPPGTKMDTLKALEIQSAQAHEIRYYALR